MFEGNHSEGLEISHSKLLGQLEERVSSAHIRMDNLDKFIDEIRKMGMGMMEMNGNVRLLAQEIKTISKTLVKHEEAIEIIQGQMETKEGMTRLYKTVEQLITDQEALTIRIHAEETKEAMSALALIRSIKVWILSSLGAIILGGIMLYLKLS